MFDKVFVVSYINNFEKRKSISEKLNELNIDFEFMYGPNLYKIQTFKKIEQECNDEDFNTRGDWFIHAVSCSLAHLNAIEYAYNAGYNNVLVIEDDVKFINDNDYILKCFNNYPKDADVIQFGFINVYDLKSNGIFTKARYSPGAQIYGLCNRKVMKDYIESQHTNYATADDIHIFKYNENNYNIYFVTPQIGIDKHYYHEDNIENYK